MLVDRGQLERYIRLRCEQGDTSAAVALVIRGYGPEILGFLHAISKNQQDAEDVFSIVCERVLRGMPAFAWECSARTWLYTIARNASSSFHRDALDRYRLTKAHFVDCLLAAHAAADKVPVATFDYTDDAVCTRCDCKI